jgi:hypothetical protein
LPLDPARYDRLQLSVPQPTKDPGRGKSTHRWCGNRCQKLLVITEAVPMSRDTIQWGRGLEYLTIGWNVLETAVSVGAGVFAGSTAMLGFGIDSLIEWRSGLVRRRLAPVHALLQ